MSKKKEVKHTLTEVEKFYLTSNRKLPVSELAETLETAESVIEEFLSTLPALPKEVVAPTREKTRMESAFGNNGKGAIVSTQAASQLDDATRKKPTLLDQSSFIHKIK